jgi:hypothetical protein
MMMMLDALMVLAGTSSSSCCCCCCCMHAFVHDVPVLEAEAHEGRHGHFLSKHHHYHY